MRRYLNINHVAKKFTGQWLRPERDGGRKGSYVLVVMAVLLLLGAVSARATVILAPGEAFRLSAVSEPGQVRLHWDIAAGYYLYRSRLHVKLPELASLHFAPLVLPQGEEKRDEALGTVRIYHHGLDIPLPFSATKVPAGPVPITVTYQGCAERGVCYPPQTETLQVTLTAGENSGQQHSSRAAASVPDGSEQARLAGILAGGNIFGIMLVFAGFGLLLAFTPCILPMIPILSSLIVGSAKRTGPWRGLGLSAAYVISMAAAYSFLGMAAGRFGQNLQAWMQNPWVIGTFSMLFVLFALAMFGVFDLQLNGALQSRLTKMINRLPHGRLTSVAAMGFLSALIVGPCVTPPLAGALLYIGQTGDMLTGGFALFALGLGMGMPLLFVGFLGGSILPKTGTWMESVRAAFAFVLLGVAVWMLSRIVPDPVTVGLWGGLLLGLGVFLGGFEPLPRESTPGRRLRKFGGVLAAVYGVLLLIGGAAGANSPIAPLAVLAQQDRARPQEVPTPVFQPLKSSGQLRKMLAAAQGRPVVVDFYADWCVSCKELERQVFSDPQVAVQLQGAILLRPDVTGNDAQDRELMQHLEVVGPPTILFYGPDGQERRSLRLVGEVSAEVFLDHLHRATKVRS